jgi:hypothetical protein
MRNDRTQTRNPCNDDGDGTEQLLRSATMAIQISFADECHYTVGHFLNKHTHTSHSHQVQYDSHMLSFSQEQKKAKRKRKSRRKKKKKGKGKKKNTNKMQEIFFLRSLTYHVTSI